MVSAQSVMLSPAAKPEVGTVSGTKVNVFLPHDVTAPVTIPPDFGAINEHCTRSDSVRDARGSGEGDGGASTVSVVSCNSELIVV